MLGCCSIVTWCILSAIMLLIAESCHSCFACLLQNRASVSGDLYIDFGRNHLIFPVAYLVCQVDALFILFPPEARISIAYHISHIIHVLHHVVCAFPVIDCGSVACVLVLGRAGRRVRERGTCRVRLRGSSFRQLWESCRQDDHPSKSLLSLLC